MINSRISGVLAAAAFLIVPAQGTADSAAQAAANAPPPIRLAPPKTEAPPPGTQAPPPAAQPAPLLKQPPPLVPDQPAKKIDKAVEVSPLQAVDPDSAGVLDQTKGGFGVDMWAGASRELVERLLPQLPVKAPSPVMHDLMRRLLLSIARAPAGERVASSLIALRVERLAAMGDAAGVSQLLDAAPTQKSDEGLSRTRVNSLFLADDTKGACDRVNDLIHEYAAPFWQKAFAYCQIVAGDKEKARLSISLLREAEADKDPAFFALARLLLGDTKKTMDAVSAATPLEIVMLRAAKQPLPADIAASADPAVLQAVASSPDADEAARLNAAERAEAAGVLAADRLAKIYSEVSFKPEELANALSEAEKDGGARGRALLYQAAVNQGVPTARAGVLQAAWKLARKNGVYGTSARVNAPLLAEMTPASELMWFAADAGRALFVAGERAHGVMWYDLAASAAARDPDARKAQAELWPVAAISDSENHVALDSDSVRQWLATEKDLNAEGWQDRAALALGLLNALGAPIDPADWGRLVTATRSQSETPGLALWTALHDARDDNRIGETVLFAMLVLGDKGPGGASPIVAGAAVASLEAVGLSDEARKLAVEAAVGAGL
ncbi:MAG TPA: hypothetical protein VI732_03120 [Alphaproteobacteria bacterium]|nr:hypothetical protein [Alphaproteobacteria bacterium]